MKRHLVQILVATAYLGLPVAHAAPGPERSFGGDGNKRGVERPEFLKPTPERQKSDIDRAADKYKDFPVKPFFKQDGSIGISIEIPLSSNKPDTVEKPARGNRRNRSDV